MKTFRFSLAVSLLTDGRFQIIFVLKSWSLQQVACVLVLSPDNFVSLTVVYQKFSTDIKKQEAFGRVL